MTAATAAKPRVFSEVVEQVLAAVPRDEIPLCLALQRITKRWAFQPPESPFPWQDLIAVLEDQIGKPRLPWHHQVAAVVRGEVSPVAAQVPAVPAPDTNDHAADVLFAQLGRALVEQVRAGATADPVAFAARWVSVVRELDGAL